jgi:quercetin dioxygenase-like cupin family protein
VFAPRQEIRGENIVHQGIARCLMRLNGQAYVVLGKGARRRRMDFRRLIMAAQSAKDLQPAFKDRFVMVTHISHTDRSSTVVAFIEPGGGLRPHLHREHDEIIVFLCGTAMFRLGDEVRPVAANDVISVPAGIVHATIRADTACVLAAVFAPGFDLANEDRVYVD